MPFMLITTVLLTALALPTPAGAKDEDPTKIRLAYGESAPIADGGPDLVFTDVEGDSRCPVDVQCVWEGECKIAVEVRDGDKVVGHHTFRYSDGMKPSSFAAAGRHVYLYEVEPKRHSNDKVEKSDYVIVLAVKDEPAEGSKGAAE